MKSLGRIKTKWEMHRGSVHPPRVSGLVGKLGCMRGQALVRSGRLEQEDFVQKRLLVAV